MADEPLAQVENPRNSADWRIKRLGGSNQVTFRIQDADPPSDLYVRPEDAIDVYVNNIASGVSLQLNMRFLLQDGSVQPMQYVISPTTDGSLTFKRISGLPEGYLLSIGIGNLGNGCKRGQCYVSCAYTRLSFSTFSGSQVLFARYVESDPICGWPYPFIESPGDDPGFFDSIAGSTPAAGADFVVTVPARQTWNVLSLQTNLLTNATAVTRAVELVIDDGLTITTIIGDNGGSDPNTQRIYCWTAGGTFLRSGIVTVTNNTLPLNMRLRPGSRIRSSTGSLQAADQWAAPNVLVQKWVEP